MKKISIIIFDCDGVMFDSRQANINFYNHLLAHFGMPRMKEPAISYVHMHTVEESVRHIFWKTPFIEEAGKYRLKMDYRPFIRDMIIEPGLKDLLGWLRPRFRLAIATNRGNTMGAVLDSHGLRQYFDIVVTSVDVKDPKPHPETIFKILAFFKVEREECVYIGDSEVDQKICQRAGVPIIAYRNPGLDAADHIKELKELKQIL